ncbi:MAG: glutaredoxin family protein [Candidatus Binatia bacterium]
MAADQRHCLRTIEQFERFNPLDSFKPRFMACRLTLYTRADCCLCQEMKAIIQRVAQEIPLTVEEIDVDSAPDLRREYGDEVPVLLINGRKAFKYRTTERELRKKLRTEDRE